MSEDLVALLGSPGLSWLVERLVTRIKRSQPLGEGVVSLVDATPEQRRAVDDLLGRRSTAGRRLQVDLAQLCECMHTDPDGLRALVASLRGPVHDLRALRDAETAGWNALFTRWQDRISGDENLSAWLDGLRRSGLLKRLASGDFDLAGRLLEHAHDILTAAPHNDILLATLAVRMTGDSHALDRGHPVATLCLKAIQERVGIDGSASAEARRDAWATLGVCLDDLSAPVLCLNLRPAPGSPSAAWIDWHVARGEPYYLTWRQVQAFDPDSSMQTVHVCENPAVVSEAANRLGVRCRPLVCLNGMPSSPVKRLLQRIGDAGIQLLLRADFDWTGLRIIDGLFDPTRCRPWRMTPGDYHACQASQPLTGTPVHPPWAGDLSAAMESSGSSGYEEDILDRLLHDLADSATHDD